ncbi:MAG: hypothetical protein ACKERG_01310 [Candidatus Hodgkinia cicadicola]
MIGADVGAVTELSSNGFQYQSVAAPASDLNVMLTNQIWYVK